ncbi:MAG: DUF4426 domain-containing protein [Idiomarina sp.]
MRTFLFALLISLVPFAAQAETQQRLGPWEVHYSAFRSTFIKPEIARQYDLQRSRYLAVINISVLAAEQAGKPAQSVDVSGYATNGIGNRLQLDFNEVKEGEAIYYLAQTSFTNIEVLRFTITIADGENTQELKFQQRFYADE